MIEGLQQRYIEGDDNIIVSMECLVKLETYPETTVVSILDAVHTMQRVIVNDVSLGLTFNNNRGNPLFFKIDFIALDEANSSIHDITEITSDDYLDMMLDKKILK